MSPTALQPQPKMKAATAATGTNGIAVASAEHSAAFVPFQWQPASFPPTQNIHSAVSPVPPADNSAGIMQLLRQMLQHLQYFEY